MACECVRDEEWDRIQRQHAQRLAMAARGMAEFQGMCDQGRATFHKMIVEALTLSMSDTVQSGHLHAASQGVH